MKYYKIILTNLPAFYKVKLFNSMVAREKILVVFTGADANIRNQDFFNEKCYFDYINLVNKSFYIKIFILLKILITNKFEKLIVGGWDSFLYFIAIFCSFKRKNELILESSYLESTTRGAKAVIKKIFLIRISRVLASGESQVKLARMLGFKGEILISCGVGLFNLVPQPRPKMKSKINNFLYVGRFSSEKNLFFLIDYFNSKPDLKLRLIGYGDEEKYLKSISKNNIEFLGAVKNDSLPKYYQDNDVLVLASKSEVWGLVVEEALNNGLPVLLSENCGIYQNLKNDDVVISFDPEKKSSLDEAVNKIITPDIYNQMQINISKMDFRERSKNQTDVYLKP